MHHHEFGHGGGGEIRREEHEIRREEHLLQGGPGYIGPGYMGPRPGMGVGAGVALAEAAVIGAELNAINNANRPAVIVQQTPPVMMYQQPGVGVTYAQPGYGVPPGQPYPPYPQQYGQYPPGAYPPNYPYPR